MKLEPLIEPSTTFIMEGSPSRDDLIAEVATRLAGSFSEIDETELRESLIKRESQTPTSTPEGVAFPHAMLEHVKESFVAAILVKAGVDFKNSSHPKCDLVFVLVGPQESAWSHISILARLARICHAPGALSKLRAASSDQDLYDLLLAEDERHG